MIISIKYGSIFDSECQGLVNTVNCVGRMGAGLALKFKYRFPEIEQPYIDLCAKGELHPGSVLTIKTYSGKYVINFPTKTHYANKSKLQYITDGMIALKKSALEHDIKSIAIPALGCDLGRLDWRDVEPIIRDLLIDVDHIDYIELYPPH